MTEPRDIFVTANFTAPLAPKFEYLVRGREDELQLALTALTKLTSGKVYIGVGAGQLTGLAGVERVEVRGPHPAGLVGVLINHTAPINKEETVWTLKASDLLVIGRFLKTGKVDFSRTIALTGSEAKETGYLEVLPGARFNEVLAGRLGKGERHERIIEGDVFTGIKVDEEHDRIGYGIRSRSSLRATKSTRSSAGHSHDSMSIAVAAPTSLGSCLRARSTSWMLASRAVVVP